MITQDEALKKILIRDYDGSIEVINVPGIICETLVVGGKRFNPKSISFDEATIGGITFKDKTISADDLKFAIAGGVIDMGGATLANVGGISSDPNDYRTVFAPVSISAGSTVTVGSLTLPVGNVIANTSLTFVAMTSSGLSVTGEAGSKIKRYLGITTLTPSGYTSTTSDDPMLDDVSLTVTDGGGGVININAYNGSPLSIRVRVVAQTTVLGP